MTAHTQTLTLKVDGMTCGHCVKHVSTDLAELPEVAEVMVTLNAGGTSDVVVTLNDVIITSHQMQGSPDGAMFENVSFNFTKVKFKYNEQDEKGNKKGGNEFGWNIKQNATA